MVLAATALFAVADVVTKHLTMLYPVSVVMAVRYVIMLGLVFGLLYPRYRARLWQTRRTGLVVGRALALAAASLTMGLALQRMPVGETVAIIYLAPFAVMILSMPILGEKVRLSGWIGAALGFLGVLLILRPGGGLDGWGVVFALLNAACATAYHLSTKFLTRSESTVALLFHVALTGTIVFVVLALPDLNMDLPLASDMGLMVALGALATMGHFLFTSAYREAPASLLAPVNYLHLVWAAGLGWLVFNHIPDLYALAGIAMVSAGGAFVAWRAHVARRAEAA